MIHSMVDLTLFEKVTAESRGIPGPAARLSQRVNLVVVAVGDRHRAGGVDRAWLAGDHDATNAGDGLLDHQVLGTSEAHSINLHRSWNMAWL